MLEGEGIVRPKPRAFCYLLDSSDIYIMTSHGPCEGNGVG